MNNKQLGSWGEQAAADYLKSEGYKILACNYRSKIGEIDIIAQKNNNIVFVEVKTRRNLNFGLPSESVSRNKQRKIINTALWYLNYTGKADAACRFDIIEVYRSRTDGVKLNHLINAFGG